MTFYVGFIPKAFFQILLTKGALMNFNFDDDNNDISYMLFLMKEVKFYNSVQTI